MFTDLIVFGISDIYVHHILRRRTAYSYQTDSHFGRCLHVDDSFLVLAATVEMDRVFTSFYHTIMVFRKLMVL